jgi:hypothetical protein
VKLAHHHGHSKRSAQKRTGKKPNKKKTDELYLLPAARTLSGEKGWTAETTLLPSPLTRLLAPKGEEGLRGGIRHLHHAATTLVNAPEGEEGP